MPRISDETINEIRSRVSIRDVVEPYSKLKRSGREWVGLSPFTNEKSPSFFVNEEKSVFYCYSSGQGGDLFRFVQLKENLGFQEAAEMIATRFNVTIQYDGSNPQSERMFSQRKEIFEINEVAAEYFRSCFQADHPDAAAVRNYWSEERGFSNETASTFRIGFAPLNLGKLMDILHKRRFTAEAITKCGLFQGPSKHPLFSHRLTIPIRDVQGRVIGFTARVLPTTPESTWNIQSKYINTPETPVFHKSDILFNLDQARPLLSKESDGQPALLVEGQLDAIRCTEVGLPCAVAPQGSAVTEGQLNLLSRFTHSLQVLLDGDSSGQRAALKIIPLAFDVGIDLEFLSLPPQTDPDDWFRQHGSAGLDKLRTNALPPISFAMQQLLPNPTQASAAQRMQTLNTIFEWIHRVSNRSLQSEYLRQLARMAGVNLHTLEADFQSARRTAIYRQSHSEDTSTQDSVTIDTPKLTNPESVLLFIGLHHADIAQSLSQVIESEWINNESTEGRLLDRLLADLREGERGSDAPASTLADDEQEQNYLSSLLTIDSASVEASSDRVNDHLSKLYSMFIKRRLQHIDQRIVNTETSDTQTVRTLMEQRIQLRKLSKQSPRII